ncbi:PadR family transcriptional regulator [Amycolatopsis endophytica]|uniref:DNA-binding PadR family transcriptional regulator n=1 Tax=Amycolatopsis endophytica TaxID=860233 RepID=A0A853AYA1_9PSEU|nr:helix-turn-helix transcriptional regulator [Amycolatopsis endophytica]NYI87594.1 DNA-binding PadR family transcriptional regulator [Amycolatopsis endophytica]
MAAAKLTPMALAILELLHERPMHPYEMTQLMRDRHLEHRVAVKPGSLYHTVDRLLAAEHIEVVGTQREGRRPERTVYALTEQGRDAFVDRAKTMLGTIATEYPEYLSGLGALDDLGRDAGLEQLETRLMRLEAKAASQEVITRRLVAEVPEIYWVDWRYTTAQVRFELDWTRQLVHDIKTGRLDWSTRDRHPARLSAVPTESTEERPNEQAS